MENEFLPFDIVVDSIIGGFSVNSILGAQACGGYLLRLLFLFQDKRFSITSISPSKRRDMTDKQLKAA